MAELLVQTVDKVDLVNQYNNAKLLKRGDVIVVVEDGWNWSVIERSNPNWKILCFPGIPAIEAAHLMSEELHTEQVLVGVNRMLQARGFYINLDSSSNSIAERTLTRAPLNDYNVIG